MSQLHLYFKHNAYVLNRTKKPKIFGMQKFYVDTKHITYSKHEVQFLSVFRPSSDHNGNAQLDKIPPLPPWLSRSPPHHEVPCEPFNPLHHQSRSESPDQPKDLSPGPRPSSSGSNGKSFLIQFSDNFL